MSVPPPHLRTRSPWAIVSHVLGKRYVGEFVARPFDTNVRFVLEDIAIQLGRIADAMEGKNDE